LYETPKKKILSAASVDHRKTNNAQPTREPSADYGTHTKQTQIALKLTTASRLTNAAL
jgi:hypothetical protein